MLPRFKTDGIRKSLSTKEKKRNLAKLRAETFSLSLKPTFIDDAWWDEFFGVYLIGAFPVRYKNELKIILEQWDEDEPYRIVIDPSQKWMFIVGKNLPVFLKEAVQEMRFYGLAKSVSGQEGKRVLHLHMYPGDSLDSFSKGFIDSNTLDYQFELWGFPDFQTMSKNPQSMNIYHFFQCADKASPPKLVELWKKSRLKYHEKKADSSLELIGYDKPYFVVKESWQPGKLIRNKKDGFRGLARVKEIVFPGCKYRFSSSLPG